MFAIVREAHRQQTSRNYAEHFSLTTCNFLNFPGDSDAGDEERDDDADDFDEEENDDGKSTRSIYY